MALNNTNMSFKVKFDSSEKSFSKIKFNKIQNTFKPKAEITPVEEDIEYDEIIYYDGGGVEGYGD